MGKVSKVYLKYLIVFLFVLLLWYASWNLLNYIIIWLFGTSNWVNVVIFIIGIVGLWYLCDVAKIYDDYELGFM